jgi:hypothetical protein
LIGASATFLILSVVMPGLDPGIHPIRRDVSGLEVWIAGSSPAMTTRFLA